MSDIKSTLRDAKTDAKETWRKADGESVGDKLADAGDRARDAVADTGDKLHEESDKASRDAAYERGRAEGETGTNDTGI